MECQLSGSQLMGWHLTVVFHTATFVIANDLARYQAFSEQTFSCDSGEPCAVEAYE
jgi:hypothetical protein